MRCKKLFSFITMIALVLTLTPSFAMAEEENVISVSTAENLAEAFAAGGQITLQDNIALSSTVTIPAGKAVTLDLAGFTVSGTCNASQASMIVVSNTATLTIKDSSELSTGKITYASGSSNVGFALDVKGNLILESGTIELTGGWSLGFAVDVRPNAWGTAYTEPTTFVMNGGKIDSSDTAVRVDSNSSDTYEKLGVYFTMNGGIIESDWDAIFIQHRYANNLYVTINNGDISGKNSPFRIYGDTVISDVFVEINGGTFDYTGAPGGSWLVENFMRGTASVVDAAEITISGGRFESMDSKYVAEDHVAVLMDGYYVVHQHDTAVEVPAKDATCTETGLTAGKKCSVCGAVTVAQVVTESTGHTNVDLPAKEATCTETGLTAGKKCSVCGTTTVAQNVIPAKDHSEVDLPAKEATCTETGLTAGKKCSVCGTVTVEQDVVAANGHILQNVAASAATYFAPGNIEYYSCSVCNKLFADEECTKELTEEDVVLAQLVKIEDNTADVSTDVVEDVIKDAVNNNTTDIVINVTQDKLAEDNTTGNQPDADAPTDTPEPPATEPAPVVIKTQLPVTAIEQVANLHEEATLTINMTNATVTLDKSTLDVVTEKAKAEQTEVIALEIERIETEQLAPAQQIAVAEKTIAAVISASILVNEKEVHDFKGGKVTVTIPFEMDAGSTASDYVVLYIADDSTLEEVPSAIADGKLVISLSHFSEYVVVNTTAVADPTNPSTGDGFDMGMMFMMLVVSAAAIVVLSSKKRFVK